MIKAKKQYAALFLLNASLMLPAVSLTAGAVPDDLFACTTSRDASNNIVVDFKEVQVTLPASWAKKCQITTSRTGATFYQIKSHDLYTQDFGEDVGGGRLFELCYSEDFNFLELPSYDLIGDTATGHYFVDYPTDVQGYVENDEAMSEYMAMSGDVTSVVSSITIKPAYAVSSSSVYSSEDYIFPQSSTGYLSNDQLSGMTGNQLQMAINEIYARHHRKFLITEVQDYFNGKSWYDGYIEAADFNASVFNTYENSNIALIIKYMTDHNLTWSFGNSRSGSSAQTPNSSAASGKNLVEVYGTVIEKGNGYFRHQQPDGTVLQFWYDTGFSADSIQAGSTIAVTYDKDTYEALAYAMW